MSTPEIAREPGWYNHPGDPVRTERWWDGLAWTDLTRDVEPERIIVNGEERTVMSFAAKHRPIASVNPKNPAQATQAIPTGDPRTDGDDMAIPGDLALHQTRRGDKKHSVTFKAKPMAGPINPKLLPPEPRSANPKSIVGKDRANRDPDRTEHHRPRRSYERDALTARVILAVALAALAVGFIAIAGPRIGSPNNQVETAFEPFIATRPTNVPDFAPPETRLGEIVELTTTTSDSDDQTPDQSSDQLTPQPLPTLTPTPGSSVYVNQERTFTMLIGSNWTPSATQTVVGSVKFQTSIASGLLPDTLSVAVIPRQPRDTDQSIIEVQQVQARATNPSAEPQRLGADASVIVFDLSSGTGSAQSVQAVVLGSAHYAVLNWTSFSAEQFAADKARVVELLTTAATT